MRVTVNQKELPFYETEVGRIASFELDRPSEVEVTADEPFERVAVRPLSRGIVPQVDGGTVRFALDRPAMVSVEFDDRLRTPLFLFANEPEGSKPDPADPNVRFFEAGRVHDAGRIELHDGQTVYVEAGAVVRGCIFAENANNIRVLGRGILDGSHYKKHETHMLKLVRCRDVLVDGVTICNSPSWTVPLYGCDDVTIRNLRIVSGRDNDDGIDVVGSQRVRIEKSFIRTKDDCVAIKATAYHHSDAGLRDVKDVRVTDSVFWNAKWGNALEIGFETRCDSISDVLFRNNDVIRCEFEGYYSGGVFTIHNGDRAVVSNVRYEDIRVENAMEKLLDFKVQHSHYSKDAQRGRVRDIYLKNVSVVDGPFPPSIIQSFDREHRVENVTIENLRVHGELIENSIQGRMIVERAPNVRFVASAAGPQP